MKTPNDRRVRLALLRPTWVSIFFALAELAGVVLFAAGIVITASWPVLGLVFFAAAGVVEWIAGFQRGANR